MLPEPSPNSPPSPPVSYRILVEPESHFYSVLLSSRECKTPPHPPTFRRRRTSCLECLRNQKTSRLTVRGMILITPQERATLRQTEDGRISRVASAGQGKSYIGDKKWPYAQRASIRRLFDSAGAKPHKAETFGGYRPVSPWKFYNKSALLGLGDRMLP